MLNLQFQAIVQINNNFMKRFAKILLAFGICLVIIGVGILISATASAAVSPVNPKPFTVPEIREWKGAAGQFEILPGSSVTYSGDDASRAAEIFAKGYKEITGRSIPVTKGKPKKGDVAFAVSAKANLKPEGYRITIGDRADATAADSQGAIWAAQTLLQMLETSQGLPKGTVTDWPEYGFRGLMLDVGRKYFPLSYLEDLVDVLAHYKMNVLHVHLNDNGFKQYTGGDWNDVQAAFRLESERFPGLAARDGHYTKKDFRDFQKRALEKGVTIVPEIDFPAHTLAFTRYRPELTATHKKDYTDHMNLDTPATYTFLDSLLDEYLEGPDPVFAGKIFHIGTDEYMGDSVTMEKFRALTDRYIRHTESKGKKAALWGSLTHAKGKTPVKVNDVLMYLWSNGYANPKEMIDLGYEVVSIPDGYVYIVPGAGYYYDFLNTKMLYDKWTPAQVGNVNIGENHPQLKGGLFAVWNDHPHNGMTVKDVHHRIFDALPVMAAKNWSAGNVTIPYEEFAEKAFSLSEAPGVNVLGRFGSEPKTVWETATLAPGMETGIPEIGYDYTVEFDLEGAEESLGTPLFSNSEATVWLSDPISGQLGYSREGKLSTYNRDVKKGDKMHVAITGDENGTRLYIDGKLAKDLHRRWVKDKGNSAFIADVRTLVFPLAKAGNFKSRIKNVKVRNYCEPTPPPMPEYK